MKKTELLLLALVIVSFVLRLIHPSGGRDAFLLAVLLLCIFYAFCGLLLFNNLRLKDISNLENVRKRSTGRKLGAVATGLVLCVTIIGILFIMQHWPGSIFGLFFGFIGLCIISVIALNKNSEKKGPFYPGILKRSIPCAVLALLCMVLPGSTWIKLNYPHNPAYIEAYLAAEANPEDEKLKEKAEEEFEKELHRFSNAETRVKAEDLYEETVLYYISQAEHPLIKQARDKKIVQEWSFDKFEETDTASYAVFQIGHNTTDEEGNRWVVDSQIFINQDDRRIYEYNDASKKLEYWEKK